MSYAVTERPRAQQQTRHDDRVGVDDPQALGAVGAELLDQRRQRRV